MAATFTNPMLGPEPFEQFETAAEQLPTSTASSSVDALNSLYYAEMEHRPPQRKLSRGKSLWSRKSVKNSNQNIPTQRGSVQKVSSAMFAPVSNASQASLRSDDGLGPLSQSVIPDVTTTENPVWEAKDLEWVTISAVTFRARHPIHNPIGPRYYKNHHTIPPHAKRDNRIPSVFSPSFPPMGSCSQDSSGTRGPSRSPSGSPLQTPNSSQTRLNDPSTKTRSRKNSQTAHDPVDLLDVSDPWGQQWHHPSPYDVGLTRSSTEDREGLTSPTSPVSSATPNPFSRSRTSVTTHSRHKTVAPSPLSQSTSAIHLHTVDANNTIVTRNVSKGRKPFRGLFGSTDVSDATPDDDLAPTQSSERKVHRKPSKRSSIGVTTHPSLMSTPLPLVSSTAPEGDKKGKRGSILGRLARRFSVSRKPESSKRASMPVNESWLNATHAFVDEKSRSPSPNMARNSKRIPVPPDVPEHEALRVDPPSAFPDPGHRSSASLDLTPITLGRLTITNPDDPSSSTPTTPAQREVSLLVSLSNNHGVQESRKPPPDDAPPPVPSKFDTPLHPVPLELPNPSESVASPAPPSVPPSEPQPCTQFLDSMNEAAPSETSRLSAIAAPALLYDALAKQANDSPLSRASLYVNPPTPYVSANGFTEPSRSIPDLHIVIDNKEGPKIRTSSSGKVRETETFKLIRSPSEKIYSSGQTLLANGEQWEVIDASSGVPKPPSKRRSDSQTGEFESGQNKREGGRRHDKERSRRDSYDRDNESTQIKRESRRREKDSSKSDSWRPREHHQSRHENTQGTRETRKLEKRKKERSRHDSGDRHRSNVGPTPSSSSSSGLTRPLSMEASRRSERAHRRSSGEGQNSSSKSSRPVDLSRRPSNSARPTSEVPSIAELNNVRAREAWEMDRLWKGRSMSMGQEGSNVISSPVSTGGDLDHRMHDDFHRANTVHGTGNGSSRTYFVVQTPFQGPPPPAPILYSHHSTPSIVFPSHNPHPPPEPLRVTPYQLAPLPRSLASLDDAASREYWAKLAGVPAQH